MLLVRVGPRHLLLPGLELEPDLLLLHLDGALLGLQNLIHLDAEGLDLLLGLGLSLLDLFADRGLGLLDLQTGLLLRFLDLYFGAFLLHFGGLLGLGDLLVRVPAGLVLVHVEKHAQAVSLVIGAVDHVDVGPAPGPVSLLHLEHADIGVLRRHVDVGLRQPLSGDAGHLQAVEGIFAHFLRESGHAQAELARKLRAHVDGPPLRLRLGLRVQILLRLRFGLRGQNT